MSVAGLRYGPRTRTIGTPLETRSASHLYSGDPASFRVCEDAIRSKRKTEASGSAAESADNAASSDHPADDEPLTQPADEEEEEETRDDDSASAADKARFPPSRGKA